MSTNKESMNELEMLRHVYRNYKHLFEGSFHTLLWSIYVNQQFSDNICAFYPGLVDGVSYLSVACDGANGLTASSATFLKEIPRKAQLDICFEITEVVFGIEDATEYNRIVQSCFDASSVSSSPASYDLLELESPPKKASDAPSPLAPGLQKHGFFCISEPDNVWEGFASETDLWNGWRRVYLPVAECRRFVEWANAQPNDEIRYQWRRDINPQAVQHDGALVYMSKDVDGDCEDEFIYPVSIVAEDGIVDECYQFGLVGYCWDVMATDEWTVEALQTREQITMWFRALHFIDGLNFHPDNSFDDYSAAYPSENTIILMEGLLEHCREVCSQNGWDVSSLAWDAMMQFRFYVGADMPGQDVEKTDTTGWLQPREEHQPSAKHLEGWREDVRNLRQPPLTPDEAHTKPEDDIFGQRTSLAAFVTHILVLHDDAYLSGHPEWQAIVSEAKEISSAMLGGE